MIKNYYPSFEYLLSPQIKEICLYGFLILEKFLPEYSHKILLNNKVQELFYVLVVVIIT